MKWGPWSLHGTFSPNFTCYLKSGWVTLPRWLKGIWASIMASVVYSKTISTSMSVKLWLKTYMNTKRWGLKGIGLRVLQRVSSAACLMSLNMQVQIFSPTAFWEIVPSLLFIPLRWSLQISGLTHVWFCILNSAERVFSDLWWRIALPEWRMAAIDIRLYRRGHRNRKNTTSTTSSSSAAATTIPSPQKPYGRDHEKSPRIFSCWPSNIGKILRVHTSTSYSFW